MMELDHHLFTFTHFHHFEARLWSWNKFILSGDKQCLKVSSVIEDHNHDIIKVNKYLPILIHWELYLIL